MYNHELGLFSYYITYCLSFPCTCSFMDSEVFKTKENTAVLELQYLKNHIKFPLIASFLEKVTCETIMMNVFFPLLIQTQLRWSLHNIRAIMAKIKLPKNFLGMVIFWVKVRSYRDLHVSSQADPTRENWTWSYPNFS